jgi:hypothetical protein
MVVLAFERVSGQGLPACVTVSGRASNIKTALLGDMSMFGWTLKEIVKGPGAAVGKKAIQLGIGGLLKLH